MVVWVELRAKTPVSQADKQDAENPEGKPALVSKCMISYLNVVNICMISPVNIPLPEIMLHFRQPVQIMQPTSNSRGILVPI